MTDAVHAAGGRVALQLLHAGRYAFTPWCVAPSAVKSPISKFRPRALSDRGVRRQIRAFARSARLAREAGYDGVEVMGSEGYLINQFLAPRTNRRTDRWGGSAENRRRFAVEVVRAVREAAGPDFLLVYRISVLDLVEEGQTWDEVTALAREVEAAGASILNLGIGWHEARVPTIVTSVPRAAFADHAARLREHVGIPVVATNRINTPEVAERVLAGGADLVSMARPFLADPQFVRKAAQGRADEINTCIACNQACLDHTFVKQRATCLLNPRAGRETELVIGRAPVRRKVVVVGGGPAGMAAAVTAAERGHEVELLEGRDHLGGQFDIAMRIPGKEEFSETIRYFTRRLEVLGVTVRLSTWADAAALARGRGRRRRGGHRGDAPPARHPGHRPPVGRHLRPPGAGRARGRSAGRGDRRRRGRGRRVRVPDDRPAHPRSTSRPGGPSGASATPSAPRRGRAAASGGQPARGRAAPAQGDAHRPRARQDHRWVHRASLRAKGVEQVSGVVEYERIDDEGLHVRLGEDGSQRRVIPCDTVVVCTGQDSVRTLATSSRSGACGSTVVGGSGRRRRARREARHPAGTEVAAAL